MARASGVVVTIPGTEFPMVDLMRIGREHAKMLHQWVTDSNAVRWLDLGGGRQEMSERDLFLMLGSKRNHARLFCLPGTCRPLGLVCLNDVANLMGSAEAWCVRGVFEGGPLNVVTAAVLLTFANGFVDLQREVIGSWTVESNSLSIAVHRKMGLKQTGRMRKRHFMGGRYLDRLLYDLTRAEFAKLYPDVPAESGRTMRELRAHDAHDAGSLERYAALPWAAEAVQGNEHA